MHPGDQFTFPQNQIRHAQYQRNRERENAREQPYGRPSRAEGLSAECVEGVEHDGNVQTDNSSGECRLSQLDKTVFIRASQSGPAAQNRPITSADKWTEIRFLTARFWADARPRRISVLPYYSSASSKKSSVNSGASSGSIHSVRVFFLLSFICFPHCNDAVCSPTRHPHHNDHSII